MRLRTRACWVAAICAAVVTMLAVGSSAAATTGSAILAANGTKAVAPFTAPRAATVQPAVTPPSTTAIPAGTLLPFNLFTGMAVDGANDQVFVTGFNSSSESGLIAMNDDGTIRQVLTGEQHAKGLAMSGGKLYVSRCTDNLIDVLDASTLSVLESIPTTDAGCELAVAGGRLWFGVAGAHPLAAMDLAAPHTVQKFDIPNDAYRLVTSRANPDVLAITNSGSPNATEVYDVSGASPVLIGIKNDLSGDITLSDDGSLLVGKLLSGGMGVVDVDTMTQVGTYPVQAHAVDMSADGILAGAYDTYPAFMTIYGAEQPASAIRTWRYGTSSSIHGGIAQRGVRFSDDDSKLFVLTDDGQFHVIESPALPAPNLTITAAATTVGFNGHTTITIHLGGSHTNRTVRLYRTPTDSPRVLVKTAAVGSLGNLSVVTPSLGRNNTFVAEYDGDASVGWGVSNAVQVKVRAAPSIAAVGSYGRSGVYRLFHYRSTCPSRGAGCPGFVGHVNPPEPGEYVTFTVQHRSATGSWRSIARGTFKLGKSSNAAILFRYAGISAKTGYWRVNMAYRGDPAHAGATTAWLYFRVTS
jgi:hypothetical protein